MTTKTKPFATIDHPLTGEKCSFDFRISRERAGWYWHERGEYIPGDIAGFAYDSYDDIRRQLQTMAVLFDERAKKGGGE